jgi:aminoglycoside phosphotransferase (APT) family kinase protein
MLESFKNFKCPHCDNLSPHYHPTEQILDWDLASDGDPLFDFEGE